MDSRSEQNPHHQVDLVCRLTVAVRWRGPQATVFRGKQQVRVGTVNEVYERATISRQGRIRITLAECKSTEVFGPGVIEPKCAIELPSRCGLEFQLGPSSHGIKAADT